MRIAPCLTVVALLACSSDASGPILCQHAAGAGEVCIAGGVFTMGHDWIANERVPQVPQRHQAS